MLPHEKELLKESEGLQQLTKLFTAFIEMLDEMREEYQDVLDPNLVVCLELMEYDAALTLNGTVKFEDVEVPGLIKQLDDAMDQVQTLQAGLPTKHGVKDEDAPDE